MPSDVGVGKDVISDYGPADELIPIGHINPNLRVPSPESLPDSSQDVKGHTHSIPIVSTHAHNSPVECTA